MKGTLRLEGVDDVNGDRKVDVDRIVRHWHALLSDAVGRYASYAAITEIAA